MRPTASLNREGFTLVELMIAMCISIIGLLAVASVAVMSIDANMGNLLRDEAVRIADARFNSQLQYTDLNGAYLGSVPGLRFLSHSQLLAASGAGVTCLPGFVLSASRGMNRNYSVCSSVTQLGAADSNAFRAQVWVGWNYKGGNIAGIAPTGRRFQHGISTQITK